MNGLFIYAYKGNKPFPKIKNKIKVKVGNLRKNTITHGDWNMKRIEHKVIETQSIMLCDLSFVSFSQKMLKEVEHAYIQLYIYVKWIIYTCTTRKRVPSTFSMSSNVIHELKIFFSGPWTSLQVHFVFHVVVLQVSSFLIHWCTQKIPKEKRNLGKKNFETYYFFSLWF